MPLLAARLGRRAEIEWRNRTVPAHTDGFDVTRAGGAVAQHPAQLGDGLVQGAVARDRAAPALREQLVAAHHGAARAAQGKQ